MTAEARPEYGRAGEAAERPTAARPGRRESTLVRCIRNQQSKPLNAPCAQTRRIDLAMRRERRARSSRPRIANRLVASPHGGVIAPRRKRVPPKPVKRCAAPFARPWMRSPPRTWLCNRKGPAIDSKRHSCRPWSTVCACSQAATPQSRPVSCPPQSAFLTPLENSITRRRLAARLPELGGRSGPAAPARGSRVTGLADGEDPRSRGPGGT